MNKPELQFHADEMRQAINLTLAMLRDDERDCRCCGTQAGKQHLLGCPAWPIIAARGSYALQADVGANPDSIGAETLMLDGSEP